MPDQHHVPLPKGWPAFVKSAVLHTISLAQYALVYTRSWAVDSPNGRVRAGLRATVPTRIRRWALVRGKPGAKVTMEVSFYRSHSHLPIVQLKGAA
jgi:hypothetical protein